MSSDDDKRAMQKAKDAGTRALRKTKGVLDSASAKKLRDRVEEYADLSSTVLAAHEDRLTLLEDRLRAVEHQPSQPRAIPSMVLAALALVVALVALVLVLAT